MGEGEDIDPPLYEDEDQFILGRIGGDLTVAPSVGNTTRRVTKFRFSRQLQYSLLVGVLRLYTGLILHRCMNSCLNKKSYT